MTCPSGATVTEFPYGDRVVLIPKVFPDLSRPANLDAVARYSRLDLIWVREPPALFRERWDARRLDREYAANPLLRAFYSDIRAIQHERAPDVILVMGDGGYWHPEFLRELREKSRVAFWTGDDPDASRITSLPFVRFYDDVFCGGVYFSRGVRVAEKFRQCGAVRATFIPLGACPDKYIAQGERSDEEFFIRQRDIDVIYVGAAYRAKVFRIVTLKRHFRGRLFLAGKRWDGEGLGLKGLAIRLIRRLGGLGEIREVSEAELVALYQRAKIGFNCHLTSGPSNLRMYELPLNGVLHVCDCEEGLREVYEVGREVVAYVGIREAIGRVEHYLRHDDERVRVARAGYRRAFREYRMEESLRRLLRALDRDEGKRRAPVVHP